MQPRPEAPSSGQPSSSPLRPCASSSSPKEPRCTCLKTDGTKLQWIDKESRCIRCGVIYQYWIHEQKSSEKCKEHQHRVYKQKSSEKKCIDYFKRQLQFMEDVQGKSAVSLEALRGQRGMDVLGIEIHRARRLQQLQAFHKEKRKWHRGIVRGWQDAEVREEEACTQGEETLPFPEELAGEIDVSGDLARHIAELEQNERRWILIHSD